MTKDYFRALLFAVGSYIGSLSTPWVEKLTDGPTVIITVAVITGMLIWVLEWAFFKLPYYHRRTRMWFLDEAIFEGDWIIEVKNIEGRPRSYGKISYNRKTGKLTFGGYALNSAHQIVADWTSTELVVDLNKNKITYLYESLFHGSGERVTGYGEINFGPFNEKSINGATGFFQDSGAHPNNSPCFLEKFVKTDVEKYIGKKEVSGPEDVKKLIRNYCTEREKAEDDKN